MRSISFGRLIGLLAVGGSLAFATPAAATTEFFVNWTTGYCLGSSGGGYSNGTILITKICSSSAQDQHYDIGAAWSVGPPGNAFFEDLVDANPNRTTCLGVSNNRTDDGAPLLLWTCGSGGQPSQNQFWHETWAGTPYPSDCMVIKNFNSNKVMGVTNDSTSLGAQVIQWTDLHTQAGHLDQIWCHHTFQ